MYILADIAHGQTNWADIFFLVAVILFAIGAVLAFITRTFYATLVAAGLAFTALALLLL
jgi:hypothetical protein